MRPEQAKVALGILFLSASVRIATAIVRLTLPLGNLPWNPPLTVWQDYRTLYVPFMQMISHGLVPYRDFAYSYPPLFAYLLTPFYLLGGQNLPGLVIAAADAFTATLIFLLMRRFVGQRTAILGGIAWAVSPLVLFEVDYLWLSSQPMLLFVILAVYLVESGRVPASAVAMALAVGFKQEAVFMLLPYLVWVFVKRRESFLGALLIIAGVIVAFSAPFLIESPDAYLFSVSNGLVGVAPSYWASITHGVTQSGGGSTTTCQATTFINPLGAYVGCGAPATYSFQVSAMLYFYASEIASVVSPVLLVVLLPILFRVRRSAQFWTMASAYSLCAGLWLYGSLVHAVLLYYFVPVYGLLLVSSNRKSVVIAILSQLVAVFVWEGGVQQLIPLVALAGIAILDPLYAESSGALPPHETSYIQGDQ